MQVDNVIDLRKLANSALPESKIVVKDKNGQKYTIAWCGGYYSRGEINSELTLLIEKV